MKRWFVIQGIFVMVMVLVLAGDRAAAGSLQVSNVFTQGNPAVAEEVNQNFTDVETSVNDNDQRISQLESALAQLAARLALHENTAPVARTGSFTISPISGNTSEYGSKATFTVQLGSQPTADVTIPISSSNINEGTVSPATLIFIPLNYNQPQLVTVTGVDDLVNNDGNQTFTIALGAASSNDTVYNGLNPADVQVTNVDYRIVDAYSVTPAISAGKYHNLVLANDGSVWGWGSCGTNQLDTTPPCSSAVVLPQQLNIAGAAAISAGYDFSAIVKSDGTVWTSGVNLYGQLGHSTSTTLAQVDNLTNAKMVAAGTYHALALKNDGSVWAWGDGGAGQLGNGSYLPSQVPVQSTGGLTGKIVTAIAIGSDHSLALDNSGAVYAWGSDGYEQLGGGIAGVDNYTFTPTTLSSLSDVSAIGAGQLQSFAVGVSATLSDAYGWGSNDDFQLGTSSGTPKSLPTAISVFSPTLLPSRLDGGPYHTVALAGNTVYTWGDNDAGESGVESNDNRGALGVGSTTDNNSPTVAFAGGGAALDVNAGANYTLVLFTDGRLQTSGKNTAAQLGSNEIDIGVATYTPTPVYVEDPSDAGKGSPSNFYAYRPILAGYPAAATTSTTATVWVCPSNLVVPANCGPITHYKYSTDNGSNWGAATAIATPISLSSLPLGSVNLWVKGMRDATTEIQSDSSAVKVSWTVN